MTAEEFINKKNIQFKTNPVIRVKDIGRAKGNWVWGQFCPLIPSNDLTALLKKAKKEKVII